jgi:hypothetical protein
MGSSLIGDVVLVKKWETASMRLESSWALRDSGHGYHVLDCQAWVSPLGFIRCLLYQCESYTYRHESRKFGTHGWHVRRCLTWRASHGDDNDYMDNMSLLVWLMVAYDAFWFPLLFFS